MLYMGRKHIGGGSISPFNGFNHEGDEFKYTKDMTKYIIDKE